MCPYVFSIICWDWMGSKSTSKSTGVDMLASIWQVGLGAWGQACGQVVLLELAAGDGGMSQVACVHGRIWILCLACM